MVRIETKDIEEAAFLWTNKEVEFEKVETKQRNGSGITVFFVFKCEREPSEVDLLRRSFYNRKALVEPKAFAEKQIDVRNILHDALRQKGNNQVKDISNEKNL